MKIKQLFIDLERYNEKEVEIRGWIRSARISKNFGFLEINDGSAFKNVQAVISAEIDGFGGVAKVNVGAAVKVRGTVVLTPNMKQPFEIQAKSVVIEGNSSPEYPLQKKRHTFEYLRTIPHLRARTNTFSAVFRIRSIAAYAIHKFFNERGFLYINTPIITGSDCEGAGEMFRVTTLSPCHGVRDFSEDFFGRPASLTVSGQLEGEEFAMAFGDIYTFGPTFRAENSNTARHAAEFWMIEPEIAFADLKDDMCLADDMLKYVINYVMENAPDDMEFLNSFVDKKLLARLENVCANEFEHVTYTEAVEILGGSGAEFKYPISWGSDLQTEHERYLTEIVYKKPVFVTDYPKEIKAFYMRMNDDKKTVAAMDCLVPGVGEIIGGSQREERPEVLTARMKELGLNEEDYSKYLDLRRFGGVSHAGFGLGFERLIMYITGMTNIRDVLPYPRTPKSLI